MFRSFILRTSLLLLLTLSASAQFPIGSGVINTGGGGGVLVADGVAASADLNCQAGVAYVGGVSQSAASFPTSVVRATTPTANQATIPFGNGNYAPANDNTLRVSDLGCLQEEARTNSVPYSSDVTQTYWTIGLTNATWGAATSSPDGGTNARKLQDSNTTNAAHDVVAQASAAFTAGATLTYSAFIKPAEYNQISVVVKDFATFTNGFHAGFTLTGAGSFSGTGVDGTGTFTSASVTAYSNGWYRITITGQIDAGTATTSKIGLYLNSTSFSGYVGVPGNGMLHWHSQLEVGTFATSPIITTTGVAVTRSEDVIKRTGVSLGSASTIYSQVVPFSPAGSIFRVELSLDDNSTANRMETFVNPSNLVGGAITTSGTVNGATGNGVASVTGGVLKQAYATTSTGPAQNYAQNGQLFNSTANTWPPVGSITQATIGTVAPTGGQPCNCFIQRIAWWINNAISTTGLITLTSTPGILTVDSPPIQATIDLNCRTNRGFNQGLTGTVASMVTVFRNTTGAVGSYVQDASNTFALANDNTLRISNLGCMAEEQRVQQVPGASTFTVGSWTAQPPNAAAGSGISTDLPQLFPGAAIWKGVFGSGDNNCGAANIIGTITNATAYTVSAWLYIKSGTGAGTPQVTIEGGGSFPAFTANADGTLLDQWQKVTATATSTGTGLPAIVLRVPGTAGATVYMTAPQFEAGITASSFIPNPTNTTVTRSNEIITVNNPPAWALPNTLYGQGIMPVLGPQQGVLVSWTDNFVSGGNGVGIINNTGNNINFDCRGSTGVCGFGSTAGTGVTPGNMARTAFSYGSTASASAVNGNTPQTTTYTSPPVSVTSIRMGPGFTGYWNQFIHRIGAWNGYAGSSGGLQTLTATPH